MEEARFYLKHQGQRGTDKQCEKLIKQLGLEAIKRMAKDRGFSK